MTFFRLVTKTFSTIFVNSDVVHTQWLNIRLLTRSQRWKWKLPINTQRN